MLHIVWTLAPSNLCRKKDTFIIWSLEVPIWTVAGNLPRVGRICKFHMNPPKQKVWISSAAQIGAPFIYKYNALTLCSLCCTVLLFALQQSNLQPIVLSKVAKLGHSTMNTWQTFSKICPWAMPFKCCVWAMIFSYSVVYCLVYLTVFLDDCVPLTSLCVYFSVSCPWHLLHVVKVAYIQ